MTVDPKISEWGNLNILFIGSERAELKHLSRRRRRKSNRFPE